VTCNNCNFNHVSVFDDNCPICGTSMEQTSLAPNKTEFKLKTLLRDNIALKGNLVECEKRSHTDLGKLKNTNAYLWLLLLFLPLGYCFFKKKNLPSNTQSITASSPQKQEFDSLQYYKNLTDSLASQHVRRIVYVLKQGDNDETIGHLFFNNPADGTRICRENGIDTREKRHAMKPGDTIIINYR
jgi:hypothetical protein